MSAPQPSPQQLKTAILTLMLGLMTGLTLLGITQAADDSAPISLHVTSTGEFIQRPVWHPNGKTVCFARHSGKQIRLWLKEGDAEVRRVTDGDLPELDASWSPDGEQLVWSRVHQTPGQGNVDVWLMGADAKEPRALLGSADKLTHEESPAWSPDGKWIALTSTLDSNQEVYLIPPTGGEPKRITQDPAIDAHPCWSPDSQFLVVATNRWGDFELARVDLEGKSLERLTESPGLDDYPTISPDGRWLAYVSLRTGNFEIWIQPMSGGPAINLSRDPGLDNFPAWKPNGDLTWVSNRGGAGFDLLLLPKSALLRIIGE